MRFNINNKVRVRLTKEGRATHAADHALFWTQHGHVKAPDYNPPKEDADGWSEWQLWCLMADFGPHIRLGGPAMFETEIEVPSNAAISRPREADR